MSSSTSNTSLANLPATFINSLKQLFATKKERNIIIDPFSCIIKLCLLNTMPEGTKISIYENKIYFNEPNYTQGVVRFIYGDNREDLHNLFAPINKFVNWYWNENNKDITEIFYKAVAGLKMLKKSYSAWATIQHTIDYYIIILMRKHKREANDILNTNNTNNNNNINNNLAANSSVNNTVDIYYDITNDDALRMRDNIDSEIEAYENENSSNTIHISDVQKFLKTLWSDREIIIIINLLKELDVKTHDNTEKNNIYETIMSYCNTKEHKLFKYIEERSSFL